MIDQAEAFDLVQHIVWTKSELNFYERLSAAAGRKEPLAGYETITFDEAFAAYQQAFLAYHAAQKRLDEAVSSHTTRFYPRDLKTSAQHPT